MHTWRTFQKYFNFKIKTQVLFKKEKLANIGFHL
jgi:hypothetical protein